MLGVRRARHRRHPPGHRSSRLGETRGRRAPDVALGIARAGGGSYLVRPMTTPRPLLPEDRRTPAVAEAMLGFHRDIVDQVRAAVERDPVVVVGMAQNPFV